MAKPHAARARPGNAQMAAGGPLPLRPRSVRQLLQSNEAALQSPILLENFQVHDTYEGLRFFEQAGLRGQALAQVSARAIGRHQAVVFELQESQLLVLVKPAGLVALLVETPGRKLHAAAVFKNNTDRKPTAQEAGGAAKIHADAKSELASLELNGAKIKSVEPTWHTTDRVRIVLSDGRALTVVATLHSLEGAIIRQGNGERQCGFGKLLTP